MAKEQIQQSVFEKLKQTDETGNEFWSARDMARILEYSEYRHFLGVIEKAREACKNSGNQIGDHFEDILDMIVIGKGGRRQVENVKLSRYACYLIVQNADPSKEIVAIGQTCFAVQTRLQEIYAVFQNHGYMGLYGGLDAKAIHHKKKLKKSQHILDHMGSTELAANLFRATQTEEKLRREEIRGKEKANKTHFEVGRKVRKTIEELRGTMPENLPVEENIKKIEQSKQKRLPKP